MSLSVTKTASKTYTLKAMLSAAAATTNPRCTVFFHDLIRQSRDDFGEYPVASQEAQLSGTNEVSILDAPAQDVFRIADGIYIPNEDTAPITVTVFRDDGSTNYQLVKKLLAVGQSLIYTTKNAWQIV